MRLFYEPKVILLARPELIPEGVDELLAEYGMEPGDWKRGNFDTDGEGLVEVMGRLCYGSFGDRQGRIGADAYLKNIISAGHGSVLEHSNWSFLVTGAGRGYTHQQVRHRAGFAYSQESTHFIKYHDGPSDKRTQEPGFCLTGFDTEESQALAIEGAKKSIEAYQKLWENLREQFGADAKVKKIVSGAARGLLPTGIESRIGITANARALRHFCEMRGSMENVLDIRLVAVQMLEILFKEAPAIFQGMEIQWDTSDGYPIVVSRRPKV